MGARTEMKVLFRQGQKITGSCLVFGTIPISGTMAPHQLIVCKQLKHPPRYPMPKVSQGLIAWGGLGGFCTFCGWFYAKVLQQLPSTAVVTLVVTSQLLLQPPDRWTSAKTFPRLIQFLFLFQGQIWPIFGPNLAP